MQKTQNSSSVRLAHIPWWNLLRIVCLITLIAIIIWPILELKAMKGLVVFSKGHNATIAWDPPSTEIVDHYVVEVTTTKVLSGPSNLVSWVNYFVSKNTRYTIHTRDGYTYSIRVKAVGPAGNESEFSNEQVTVICDSSEPKLYVFPFEHNKTSEGNVLHLKGKFTDPNLAGILVNGREALIDFAKKTWEVDVPLSEGSNFIKITARDYAGNSFSHQFQVQSKTTLLDTKPQGSDIFIMGTPTYPGIFVAKAPINVAEIVDSGLNFPLTIKKEGYMQLNTVISFAGHKDSMTFNLKKLLAPTSFSPKDIRVPAMENLHERPCLFPVDWDQDNKYEVILSYPSGVAFLLKNIGENGWNATSLTFQMEKRDVAEPVQVVGPVFVIDYDGDFEYEMVAPLSEDGFLHVFECNGTVCTTGTEAIIKIPEALKAGDDFGFLDWNHDNKKDLFFKAKDSETVKIFFNQKSDFSPIYSNSYSSYRLEGLRHGGDVFVCDWNGDGEPDFLGQDGLGRLCVWLNVNRDGKINLEKRTLPPLPLSLENYALGIAAFDWNRDGIFDLLLGSENGDVYLLTGEQE